MTVSPTSEELAARHGTPFYLYDLDWIRQRMVEARRALPFARLIYAAKANPSPVLLRELLGLADGIDVASRGEIEAALQTGWAPGLLSFAGPAKTIGELREAVAQGLCISVESPGELEVIAALARDTPARITLRVNPRATVRTFAVPISGRPSPFGVDEEELEAVAARIAALAPQVRFEGLHVHAGSQCPSARAFFEGAIRVLDLAEDLQRRFGLLCSALNFGGGFGVALGESGRDFDVVRLGELLGPALDKYAVATGSRPRAIFELGRWLVAGGGQYFTRVVSVKKSRGVRFVIVDGGMHHLLAHSAALAGPSRPQPQLSNVSRPDAALVTCTIAGRLCTPLDVIAQDVRLPEPEIGDLLAVHGTGAYGLTMSPILFLGHDVPAELVRDGERIVVSRHRRSALD